MKNQNDQKASGWFILLTLVAYGIYAFILSLIGGAIVWMCLGLGASYEVGIIVVLAFFVLELILFFSAMRSPAVKATNVLLRPIIFVAGRIVSAWPCVLSKNIEKNLARELIRVTSKFIDPR